VQFAVSYLCPLLGTRKRRLQYGCADCSYCTYLPAYVSKRESWYHPAHTPVQPSKGDTGQSGHDGHSPTVPPFF
jgi:hypothetical protein